MIPENYIVITPIVLFIVASLAVTLKKETAVKVSSIISAIGSLALILVSFIGFMHDIDLKYIIWDVSKSSILSSLCTVHIHIDKLSSIFIGLTGIIALLASVYAIKYIEKYKSGYHRLLSFSYPLTILTMYLIFVSWDLLWLLIFWELLTLFSQFIVVFKGDKEAISGAYQYFTITKACADMLVIALVVLIIIVTGIKTSYDDVSLALRAYFSGNKALGYLLAILALVGFGAKAGLAPFHTWLPKAHPAAPTPISAILSGLIVKTGVYALMRTFLVFFPTDATIGLIIASFGVLTIIVGNMRALTQDDSKRLLAYSTIGQIGYILLSMGAGIYLIGTGQTLLGGFALVASLYHTINHAFFKSL
ncbi:MAG: hydantoin racemase, partial [Thermoplasmata archaeon]